MGRPIKACIFALSLVLLPSNAWTGGQTPQFILQWGSNGAGNGQFSGPHGIEVGADGNVFVVDTGNNRIQKFTSNGVFLLKWGSFGASPGQFNHPHGIGSLESIWKEDIITRFSFMMKFFLSFVFVTQLL